MMMVATSAIGGEPPAERGMPTVEELEAIFKNYGTLQYESTERDLGADQTVALENGFSRYVVCFDVEGRRTIHGKGVKAGSSSTFLDLWEDGQYSYRIQRMGGNDDLVNLITKVRQTSTVDKYDGPMNMVLWVFTPGGTPVYSWVKNGAALSRMEMDTSKIRLSTDFKGTTLTCHLDRAHDWLPSEIMIAGGMNLKITEFKQDSGSWYPSRGLLTRVGVDKVQSFEVEKFRFRANGDRSLSFNPVSKKLNPGAVVVNPLSREGYFPAGSEGPEARRRMLAEYSVAEFDDHTDGTHQGWVSADEIDWIYRVMVFLLLIAGVFGVFWGARKFRDG